MGVSHSKITDSLHMKDLTFNLTGYVDAFANLRVNKNYSQWTATTKYKAPHKPLLLLSILDLFNQDCYENNFIELSCQLIDTFNRYWMGINLSSKRGNIALPFFYLRSSHFWHLIPVSGKEDILLNTLDVSNLSQLRKLILGASFDDKLYCLVQENEPRNILRTTLITTYFSPDHYSVLGNLTKFS
jgi:putative restriction endonuclease